MEIEQAKVLKVYVLLLLEIMLERLDNNNLELRLALMRVKAHKAETLWQLV